MNLSPENTHSAIKLVSAFGLAYGADQFVFKRVNPMESASFAGSCALGVVAGDLVGSGFAKLINWGFQYLRKFLKLLVC